MNENVRSDQKPADLIYIVILRWYVILKKTRTQYTLIILTFTYIYVYIFFDQLYKILSKNLFV